MARSLVLSLAFLAACAVPGGGPSPLQVEGLQFENRSRTAIESIDLTDPASGNFVSCGHIAPGGVCASGFPGVAYSGGPVIVSWRQGGSEWSTGEVTLKPDPAVRKAGRGEVRVVVLSPGSAGVVLVDSGKR